MPKDTHPATPDHRPFAYPETPETAAHVSVAGRRFDDPYQWLERTDADVSGWQQAQNRLARDHVSAWPGSPRIAALVERYATAKRPVRPRRGGALWFTMSDQRHILAHDRIGADGRLLVDLDRLTFAESAVLTWFAPSPDGRILAIGICTDGSDNNHIQLVDVATGLLLADPPTELLMDGATGGVHWLPDASGFFFSAITGAASDFEQEVFFHDRSATPVTSMTNVSWQRANEYRAVMISSDGRYAVAVEGMMDPRPLAILDLTRDHSGWIDFVTDIETPLPGHVVDGAYYAVTTIDAPRGRVVAIDLDSPAPNDPAQWRTIVPESGKVLRMLTPVGDLLAVTGLDDTFSTISLFDRSGRSMGDVALPGRGALAEESIPMNALLTRQVTADYIFAFSSFTQSAGVYLFDPVEKRTKVVSEPSVIVDGLAIDSRRAASKDGTAIPYHVVCRAGAGIDGPRPALIYAYGGFNNVLHPEYPGAMMAFVEAGGVFVHAHLRGGGEYGGPWWEGGRLRNKQNCFDDLYAVAEDLIARGISTPDRLAMCGQSNGGLVAAVAALQRPDLWAVSVPRVPIVDLIGCWRDGYARSSMIFEYGDLEQLGEADRVMTFSPYHLVREDLEYPAFWIEAGGEDPRCPPWHARKLAARLQSTAGADTRPVMLRIWDGVGHGSSTGKEIALRQDAEWIAFVAHQLGMTPHAE